ncbi:MAG: hypothetical protein QXU62_06285 [Thermofilaceae archaeon]
MSWERYIALHEVLREIAASNVNVIEPSISHSTGVIYPLVLKVAASYGVSETEVLEELNRLGVLESEPHENIVVCPSCGSLRLFSKLHCPNCGSDSLRKTLILAHVTCGGVNVVEETEKPVNCSKCGKPLKETKDIGILYQCRNCGARFEAPLPSWRCADCKSTFDYKKARYTVINRYRVRKDRLPEAAKHLLVAIVTREITATGLKVISTSQVKGKSGYYHTVDIVASGDVTPIYLDIIAESSRALGDALSSIAKATDLEGQHIVLVPKSLEKSTPSTTESNVVFYENAKDLQVKIDNLLKKLRKK